MRLHTGKEIPDALVAAYMLSLKRVRNAGMTGVLALTDLRAKAEDPRCRIFSSKGEKLLKECGFLRKDGSMHEFAQDFILAAVRKRGNDIDIVNPRTGR